MTEQLIFLDVDGSTMGPLTLAQVRTLHHSGQINAETLYAFNHGQEWLPLKTILPLLNAAPVPVPMVVPVPPVMPADPPAQSSSWLGGAERVCAECGTPGNGVTHTAGSFFIEVILWLCFLVPGVIYSVWRLTTRCKVCRQCGSARLIPSDSPAARALMR